MIEISVLGPVEVRVDGGPAPAPLLWRPNLVLLVYLARSPKRARSRQHLLGLLWPDKLEARARGSLAESIREIRQTLGSSTLVTEGDLVRLAPDVVRLDTERFEALADGGDWAGAAALVMGQFMEGFTLEGSTPFEEYLSAERRQWDHRCADALVRHAESALSAGHLGTAKSASTSAARIAPFSEGAIMTLMRALALDGNWGEALAEYETFAKRLARRLGTQPSPACAALADRIRNTRGTPKARSPSPRPTQRRAPLVGRAADLERLWAAWCGCKTTRKSTAAILVGDAGAGKTRLSDEMVARMRLDGAAIALIRAVPGDRDNPWSGIIGLARGGLGDAAGLVGAPPSALAWFAERIPEWAERFPVDRQTTPEASPVRAFGQVLQAVLGDQPVALAVDDAELLDSESLTAIRTVLRDLQSMALFALLSTIDQPARPEVDELRSRLGRDVDGLVVELRPLDPAAINDLARWALPRYEEVDLDRITRRVNTDSAGLPLLAVELLTAVGIGLNLAKVRGAWPEPFRTLAQTFPGGVPEGIVAAIRTWFHGLTPTEQHVLQAVALLEDRVPAVRVARATGLPLDTVVEALDSLEWGRWLTVEGRGYAFVARIVRQVIDEDLTTETVRQALRAAAGPADPEGGPPPRTAGPS
jgi:DNA-binding SARP family transcriptional activator